MRLEYQQVGLFKRDQDLAVSPEFKNFPNLLDARSHYHIGKLEQSSLT